MVRYSYIIVNYMVTSKINQIIYADLVGQKRLLKVGQGQNDICAPNLYV